MVPVDGVVRDARHKPVAGASIYVQDVPHPSDGITRRAAVSDEEGRFTIANVPVPTTRLFATHADFAPAGVAVLLRPKTTAGVKFTLAPGGTVAGTVLMDGSPITGAWTNVDYYLLGERIYENASTDGQGRFAIHNVPPGDAAAHLHLEIGSHLHRTYEVPVAVSPGEKTDVLFSLVGGAAVVEGVVTAVGDPVRATITITIPLADGTEEVSTVNSREDGTFIIPMLPEAPIVLRARDEERREKEIE